MNAIIVNNKESEFKVHTYINDSEIDEIIDAIRNLEKYEQFDLSWKICLANAIDLSDLCAELQRAIPADQYISNSKLTLIKYNLGKLIVNFLSSYFNFLSFCEIYSKKWFGDEEYKRIKGIISKYYDDGYVYKFYYKFRNYITHFGLPIDTSFINKKDEVHKLHFVIFKEKLLKFDGWGKSLKDSLIDSADSIDITGLFLNCRKIASYIAKEIHIYILEKINPSISLISSKLGDTINSEDTYSLYIFNSPIPIDEYDWKSTLEFRMIPISTIALNPSKN